LPTSLLDRPPVVIPPTWVEASTTTTLASIRRAWIAAVSPAAVAP